MIVSISFFCFNILDLRGWQAAPAGSEAQLATACEADPAQGGFYTFISAGIRLQINRDLLLYWVVASDYSFYLQILRDEASSSDYHTDCILISNLDQRLPKKRI